MTDAPDFAVLTAAKVPVRTFADRKAALAFADANVAAFGLLTVVRIERIIRTTRLRTVRYHPQPDDLAIPEMAR
jgi:hypothetical protein